MTRLYLPDIVGKGYATFWKDKEHRYVAVKGSRGSKKSKTTALWIIYNMMKYDQSNTLVIRKAFNTLKDSCFTDLKWACNKLGVAPLWKFTKSPLEITYLPTGQKILFRGLDNPLSITSIAVEKGVLNFAWFEESYQINNEDDFNKVDMSIRGELPPGYFFRIMVTFNPWNERHWLKKRFFDGNDDNVLALTTTYKCNEWIGEDFIKLMEDMKIRNPRRYRIEGDGDWGIAEGLVFDNWNVEDFDIRQIEGKNIYGLDFGYNDPTTIICSTVDEENKKLYVYQEFYKSHMTPSDIVAAINRLNLHKAAIYCDCARPEIIEEMKRKGCRNVKSCSKGKDSILTGIQKLQEYEIIVHPDCEHVAIELSNYSWDTDRATGETLDKPIDDYNHCVTGDTIIDTVDGPVPIRDLIGKEGEVFCYDEENKRKTISKFFDVRMTRKDAEIYEVETMDGRKIRCTGDHLILTTRGWKEARKLRFWHKIVDIR